MKTYMHPPKSAIRIQFMYKVKNIIYALLFQLLLKMPSYKVAVMTMSKGEEMTFVIILGSYFSSC
jgi:hypothetical protein